MPQIISRVDRITSRTYQKEFYSDFTPNFDLNPITSSLVRLTNEDSVKQSVKNLVLTNPGERHYHNDVGCGIKTSLFDPLDEVTMQRIKGAIEHTLKYYEPRIEKVVVEVTADVEDHAYDINVFFSIINIPDKSFTVPITYRIR